MDKNQLINFLSLNQSNLLAVDCLERISRSDEFKFGAEGLAPLAQIIETYSRRERINTKLNDGIIEGYEHLLPSLRAANVSNVRLYSLEFLSHWFTFFTDEQTSHLYGVLKSPKKKAVWFNPITGYE
jgi:hypothetical protein